MKVGGDVRVRHAEHPVVVDIYIASGYLVIAHVKQDRAQSTFIHLYIMPVNRLSDEVSGVIRVVFLFGPGLSRRVVPALPRAASILDQYQLQVGFFKLLPDNRPVRYAFGDIYGRGP